MTEDLAEVIKPDPREEAEIFADLRNLAATPGFAHIIAYLCARDNYTLFSGELTADQMQGMYSRSRIIRTEMSLLIGLMVQALPDYDALPPIDAIEIARHAESLLEELHDSLNLPMRNAIRAAVAGAGLVDQIETDLREPIFYGGEGGFSFQCCALAAEKYREHEAWLLENRGASIDHMIAVAEALDGIITERVSAAARSSVIDPGRADLLSCFMVTAAEVAALFGVTADAVRPALTALTLGRIDGNAGFRNLGDYNAVNGTPILDAGDDRYLLFHFNALAEALYETPFYWMYGDAEYRNAHREHRGRFAETFALRRLEAVFGAGRVLRGVMLHGRKGETISEIDTLVVFADRAIILQAKSKRLTLAARRGADLQLRSDFKAAVQDAHDQAMVCAERLLDPTVTLRTAEGEGLVLDMPMRHIYPVCLVADHYPALHYQTGQFLKMREIPGVLTPLVIDVFTLDALCEMLDRPLRLLSYLDLRARYSPKVIITHEMTLLGYHLKYNLWLEDDCDAVMLEDDFTADLEIAMAARRIALPGARSPRGILTVIQGRRLDQLLAMIEDQPHDAMVELGHYLDRILEGGFLVLRGFKTGQPYQRLTETGEFASPTKQWLEDEFSAGSVKKIDVVPTSKAQFAREADAELIHEKDPRAIVRQIVLKSLDRMGDFSRSDAILQRALAAIWESKPRQLAHHVPPSPSTVRRWLRQRGAASDRPLRAMVSASGRVARRGRLPASVRRRMHEAAAEYWSNLKLSVGDAYDDLVDCLQGINNGIDGRAPSAAGLSCLVARSTSERTERRALEKHLIASSTPSRVRCDTRNRMPSQATFLESPYTGCSVQLPHHQQAQMRLRHP